MYRCQDGSSLTQIIMATKDSASAMQSKLTTTPTGEESVNPVTQPSGLGELSTQVVGETDRRLEVMQRAQVSSLMGADKGKEPQEKTPKKLSPTLATQPKTYALEMWVKLRLAQVCTPPLRMTLSALIS